MPTGQQDNRSCLRTTDWRWRRIAPERIIVWRKRWERVIAEWVVSERIVTKWVIAKGIVAKRITARTIAEQ